MSIKEYKKAFSGIEPDKEVRDALVERIMEEERQSRRTERRRLRPGIAAACAAVMVLCLSATAAAAFDINEMFQGFFRRPGLCLCPRMTPFLPAREMWCMTKRQVMG